MLICDKCTKKVDGATAARIKFDLEVGDDQYGIVVQIQCKTSHLCKEHFKKDIEKMDLATGILKGL